MFCELQNKGLLIEKQKALPLIYKEVKLVAGYRLDLLVENKVIIEIKAVETLNAVPVAQVLTNLRLSGCKLDLLMDFTVLLLKDGLKRLVIIYNFVLSKENSAVLCAYILNAKNSKVSTK
jgi:GxxExxY protein